jgi:hypothetical protein
MKLSSKLSAPAGEVKQSAFVKPEFVHSHNFHGALVFKLCVQGSHSADSPRTYAEQQFFPSRKPLASKTAWDIAMGNLL